MNLEPKALDVNDRFVLADFETVRFLGTGSFGRVNLVRFKDEARHEASQACAGHKYFALKVTMDLAYTATPSSLIVASPPRDVIPHRCCPKGPSWREGSTLM
jgi:hypothetical protein